MQSPELIPKISIVISTLGRSNELLTVLNSLEKQSYKNFEVIIVDQNDDDRVASIANLVFPYVLRRLSSNCAKGLSIGRNIGWNNSRGEIILFADDDCWYPPNFLHDGLRIFSESNCDILSGRAASEKGDSVNGRYETQKQLITKRNVWTTQIEWVVFFKKSVLAAVGGYDPLIGIGAASPWQSGEGQDIMLRAISHGFMCFYDPNLYGHHAIFGNNLTPEDILKKAQYYGRGMGHVLRRHKFTLSEKIYWLIRPLLGSIINFARDRTRSRYFLYSLAGRFEGLVGKPLF